MISNFNTKVSLKILHELNIPKPPCLIEPMTGFWLLLCLSCMCILWFQSEYSAFLLISIPFAVSLNYVFDRFRKISKTKYYHKNLESIRKIIETPTMTKNADYTEFKFISCSDRIKLDLEKMLEISTQENLPLDKN